MKHNSTQPLGINKEIYYNGTNVDEFEMWELVGDGDANDITPTVNITEVATGLYKQTVTLPEHDCIVFMKFNGDVMFLRVGVPVVEMMWYSGVSDAVTYDRLDVNGSSIENGTLDYRGQGVHSFKPNDNEYSIICVDGEKQSLDVPYVACDSESGQILLQRGVWQMIAINNDSKVAEYFCDRLADQEGVAAKDLIEVVNTYRGSDNKFLSYIPGITAKTSVNNFTLSYNDESESNREISAFWVKTREWAHTADDIIYTWEK